MACRPKKQASAQAVRLRVIRTRPVLRARRAGPARARRGRRGAGRPALRSRTSASHGSTASGRRARPTRASPEPPAAAQRVGQRHGHGGRGRGAQGERHRVEAGHRADPVGELPLDDDRHQDVADGDAREGEGAGGEEAGRAARERAAAAGPRRWRPCPRTRRRPAPKRRASRGAATPKTAKHSGGTEVSSPATPPLMPSPSRTSFEQRAETGDGGAEVEGAEHDADDDQPGRPRARGVARGHGGSLEVTRARTA